MGRIRMITEAWQYWWLAAVLVPLGLVIAMVVWFCLSLNRITRQDDDE